MNLEEIREEITDIDLSIIELIAKRLSLIDSIVEIKRANNLSAFQPEREKELQRKYWNVAVEKRINPELIRKIFELLIEEMRFIQERMMHNA